MGQQRGLRGFWKGPKFLNYCMPNSFKLRPTHFPRGRKMFSVGFALLVTVLIKTSKFSFSEMLRRDHICDRLRKVARTTVEQAR